MKKKTVVFDFDGVIHSYTSGWQGVDRIPDAPVPGIKEAIADIREAGYEVVIVSTRCNDIAGKLAIGKYCENHGIVVDVISEHKPPAVCYIDDRAICFDGRADLLKRRIADFEPWYKKPKHGGIVIRYDEDREEWNQYDPYISVDCMTKEDFEYLKAAVEKQEEDEWEVIPGLDPRESDTCRCAECGFVGRSDEAHNKKYCPNCGKKKKGGE